MNTHPFFPLSFLLFWNVFLGYLSLLSKLQLFCTVGIFGLIICFSRRPRRYLPRYSIALPAEFRNLWTEEQRGRDYVQGEPHPGQGHVQGKAHPGAGPRPGRAASGGVPGPPHLGEGPTPGRGTKTRVSRTWGGATSRVKHTRADHIRGRNPGAEPRRLWGLAP